MADTTGATTVGVATAMVTASVCMPEDETMPMVPVQVAGAVNEDGSTETVKLLLDVPAVKLPVGVRFSQLLVVQLCSEA